MRIPTMLHRLITSYCRPGDIRSLPGTNPANFLEARLSLLDGDKLGELGDVCHRIFCSTQAASRAEQGADFAESFVRRAMHD